MLVAGVQPAFNVMGTFNKSGTTGTTSFTGTSGACGVHQSDPNAICLVTEWRGFTTGPGPVGGGTSFGPTGVALCNLTLKAGCPDKT